MKRKSHVTKVFGAMHFSLWLVRCVFLSLTLSVALALCALIYVRQTYFIVKHYHPSYYLVTFRCPEISVFFSLVCNLFGWQIRFLAHSTHAVYTSTASFCVRHSFTPIRLTMCMSTYDQNDDRCCHFCLLLWFSLAYGAHNGKWLGIKTFLWQLNVGVRVCTPKKGHSG